ncbi:MAG: TetR/AcrR family transcriptional regulator [Chromatiales bacterium]|nr:TetR/AcrR family transcriptional regulator [Chromatiales bacterium]MDX9766306.1 TetR/AcrR family transcriptional regulator [Ectothiorhodospiraceae bacterium]
MKRPSKSGAKTRQSGSGRGAKASYHHGDLRPALVSAAAGLLEDAGSGGVSLREVARRCGVSQAAPYRHFASREALLAAVATEAFREFARVLSAHADETPDPLARLKALGRGYVAFAMEHPETFRLMFGPECAQAADDELKQAAHASYALLADTVAACVADPGRSSLDRATMTIGSWALMHGLARLTIDMPGDPIDLADMDPATRVARVIDAFVDGLLRL